MGNVGLSASAESVHQIKRSSQRRAGSRHSHLHRSSSRRNKENGNSRPGSFRNKNSENGKDDNGGTSGNRIRKTRAVSFEQPTTVVPASVLGKTTTGATPKWHEYALSMDEYDMHFHNTQQHRQPNLYLNNVMNTNTKNLNENDDNEWQLMDITTTTINTSTTQTAQQQQHTNIPTTHNILHHFKPPRI